MTIDLISAAAPDAPPSAEEGFRPFPAEALAGSVGERFGQVALRHGARLAIGDGETRLTYAELAGLAGRVARAAAAARSDGPVAALFRHDHRFSAAVLGVMASGRPCVPLDADHPIDRNARIARHAGVAAVISTGALAAEARALFGAEIPVLELEALPEGAGPPPPAPGPDDVACILYTSGSTGAPKGVFQSHRGVLHDIAESVDTGRVAPADRFALFYSPTVIAGLRNLLSVVLTGASGEILSPAGVGPRPIVDAIATRGLTILRASPTLFRHIVKALEPQERLQSVRSVLLGGERVDWGDVDVFRRGCRPDAALHVHAGATECWTLHTQWRVDEAVRPAAPRLPVGRTVAGRKVTLVGPDGAPAPDGEPGEIVVSSPHLALGYWRDPEATARSFGADPRDPASRTYRTGDLAVRRPDGLLDFLGRQDQQIKLNGRRVEPGEVEGALRACSGVLDAAVVVRRDASGAVRAMAAYAQLKPGMVGLYPRHLRAMLADKLPAHMMPAEVFVLVSLPWLPNYKVDRQRLARFDADYLARAAQDVDDVTRQVAAAFDEAVGSKGAGPDDNFLSLGGDSLQAIGLSLMLEGRFGLALGDDGFDPARSIGDWARLVRSAAAPPFEPAHHGEVSFEERLACARELDQARRAGRQPDLTTRPAFTWASTVQLMLISGRIQLAQWSLAQMARAFPGMAFHRELRPILAAAPPAEGLTPFKEDPAAQVQVAPRPGAQATLVFFAGGGEIGMGLPLALLHRWIGKLDANLVYLRPFDRDFYLGGMACFGPGPAALVAGVRGILDRLGAPRTGVVGNSMGGFGAIRFGLELNADAVLALSPQTIIGPEFAGDGGQETRRRLRAAYPGAPFDLRPLWQAAARRPRLVVGYGEDAWDDRLQAERLDGLPNVELRPIPGYDGHLTPRELIRRGAFLPLLREVFEGGGPDA